MAIHCGCNTVLSSSDRVQDLLFNFLKPCLIKRMAFKIKCKSSTNSNQIDLDLIHNNNNSANNNKKIIPNVYWGIIIHVLSLMLTLLAFYFSSSDGKESAWNAGDQGSVYPWVRNIPWRREWQPSPIFLPGEFHEQRSLAGYRT